MRVFLLNLIPAGQARVHLETMAGHSDAEVARLSELRDSTDRDDSDQLPDQDFFALAALDYGLRLNAMRADWARDVIAKLDARRLDGCIAIVSDISSTYRKHISCFLSREGHRT